MNFLLVFLGGGLGSVCRYAVGKALGPARPDALPMATLAVNLIGCALVGLLARYLVNMEGETAGRALLIIGFCGGFTTFSAFSLETAAMITSGRSGLAAAYILTSVVGCVLGTSVIIGRR